MAKLLVFTVFDSKVEAFLQPFFARTIGEALRMWETTVMDSKSMMSMHPSDFTLFQSAEYDEAKGRFTQLDALKNLGTALEVRSSAVATQTTPVELRPTLRPQANV